MERSGNLSHVDSEMNVMIELGLAETAVVVRGEGVEIIERLF